LFGSKFFWRFGWFHLRVTIVTKHGVCAAVVFIGLCLSALGQQIYRPEIFGTLNNSSPRFSSLALSNTQYVFLATGLNWIDPLSVDFLPPLPAAPPVSAGAAADSSKDSSKEVVDLSRKGLVDYVHGEVGFLYGRSTGKFDREVEQGWVIGTTGNDKFSITAGASFENWSGRERVPRH
jgi:hypothetical protein